MQLPPKQTILRAPQLFKFLLPTALHCQLPKKFLIKTYTCKLLEDSIRGGNISKEYKNNFFLPELDVRRPEEIFEFYRYGSISIIQLVRVDLADAWAGDNVVVLKVEESLTKVFKKARQRVQKNNLKIFKKIWIL